MTCITICQSKVSRNMWSFKTEVCYVKSRALLYCFINDVRNKSSPPEVLIGKGFLKIYSKITGKRPFQSASSVKLLCNFIEMTLWHGCSTVNLLHIFRTTFPKNTSEGILLENSLIKTSSIPEQYLTLL